MITQDITIDVIGAEVTDDCRVAVFAPEAQDTPVVTLTASQARQFAVEVMQAIGEAERAAGELLREHAPFGFDVTDREAGRRDAELTDG